MQSEIEQRLRKAVEQCAKRGFENFTVWSSRGDCNCPYPVSYHPKDGHGYEDEKQWFDLNHDGKSAAFDEDVNYIDPLEVLCRVFESFPEIIEREKVGK